MFSYISSKGDYMMKEGTIRIIPLGGLGEIGKNITAIEYEDEIIVIDCGIAFPDEDMYGVDLIIPDITYLINNRKIVKGFFLTHGHEDHIDFHNNAHGCDTVISVRQKGTVHKCHAETLHQVGDGSRDTDGEDLNQFIFVDVEICRIAP